MCVFMGTYMMSQTSSILVSYVVAYQDDQIRFCKKITQNLAQPIFVNIYTQLTVEKVAKKFELLL
jgi:hypothetical protein